MKSILGKLWLGITSLVVFILLIVWIFQVGLLNKFYISERKNILINEGKQIAELILNSNQYGITEKIIDEIHSFSSSYNTNVVIANSKSNIIFYSVPKIFVRNNIEADEILRRSLFYLYNDPYIQKNIVQGNIFTVQKHNPAFKDRLIIVGIPIKNKNNIIGTILLTSPLAPIEEASSILRKQLSLISIISLLIGTLLALVFSKTFTKPILKIINTSKRIAKGDFEANVDINSEDEIGILGDTVNNMAVQLGQIEKLRKEFIANISHELKTPISLIKAYAELVMDVDDNEKDRKEHLNVIIDESNRLNRMVEDILYLSKMEANYSNPYLSKFPIINVIEDVIQKLSFFADKKNISINIDIDNQSTEIYADKEKIHQVFFNLINNAIRHSFENGQVTIKVYNINNIVKVEISDNGKGIPEEDLPYIWDRFYKADKSRKRNDSGTGLGMSIVKNILEIHNFNYGIKSKINQGTTVWFEIKKT
ncbi:sensor histidine kinase [Caldisalinibacter kiritimatiensis]|uniref:histidine kinase n=1 Tax=Caldisalinibacter kiritimatiensis TaxID=1304284 RepID=R1AV97_9FIRM|nr:HAMP domain-containing sensor histidine kinase [Caldisalinibacter kiritimatiensis]EOD01113.1 Osmosensitive K+ channel histidine kinase KdpD [Caldisalinibacter kiritimatiensis]